VFTVATVSFYCLGATVLHRQGLHPQKQQMIETLSQMYVPAFGDWTKAAFLIGVWAVLFKTMYVSSASNGRLITDFLGLIGAVRHRDPGSRNRWIRRLAACYPAVGLVLYLWVGDPKAMVVFGGFFQAATLPVIAGATLYLRYRRTDERLAPSRTSDALLWTAAISIAAVAAYAVPMWLANDAWPAVRSWLASAAA
jgi:Mn2+/Fe2+ NRAMP family transporter